MTADTKPDVNAE